VAVAELRISCSSIERTLKRDVILAQTGRKKAFNQP
jgi:hypothetical protein